MLFCSATENKFKAMHVAWGHITDVYFVLAELMLLGSLHVSPELISSEHRLWM